MKNKSYIGISFIILIFGIWTVNEISVKFQKSDLAEIGPVPAFELTNQEGKKITNKDYEDKVYVVEFFFSTCPTICPIMNQNMLKLQKEFYGNPKFGIASITINPEYDTPTVLKEHAEQLGVKHYNWHFLTGDKDYIYQLAEKGFNLYAGQNENAPGGFEHSGYFALVDKEGNIRSRYDDNGNPIFYYSGLNYTDKEGLEEDLEGTHTPQIDALIEDIEKLLEE